MPERRHYDWSLSRDVPLTALRDRALEQPRGFAELSPGALEVGEIERSYDDAIDS
jgi:hypothetical protein